MRKIAALVIVGSFMFSSFAFAEYVRGYTRQNGTYVDGYYRSNANGTVYDNYSSYGNRNPYTDSYVTSRYYGGPSVDRRTYESVQKRNNRIY